MEYLLVLQWPLSSSRGDLDVLISLEDDIRAAVGDLGTVDGHDIGSGEMNIFIFAEDPKAAFKHIEMMPSIVANSANLRARYRQLDEDEYTPIFPAGLEEFGVI